MNLPDTFRCPNGVLVEAEEALCVCLKRFAYQRRYTDLTQRFGRPVPQLCMIANFMVDYLFSRYGDLLHNLNQAWLSPQSLQMYADAIHDKGASLDNCWDS